MRLIPLEIPDREGSTLTGRHLLPEPPGWMEFRSARTLNGRAYTRGELRVIVSAREETDGRPWLHVSVSRQDRVPSYADLVLVTEAFIGRDRTAVQVFPPSARHVSRHPYCLHLFACLAGDPLPDFRWWNKAENCWEI